jgi:MFS family permease
VKDMSAGPLAASPAEAPYPPARQAWSVIAIFAVAAVLQYTDRQILSLLVDPIRADLGISDTQISVLQGAAFAVLYSLVGLPLGRTADILPRRSTIIAGIALWSLATAACGLATGFGQLLVCRICVGIGEAALAPAAVSMIADYFPAKRRGTAIGVFIMGQTIGGGAAIAIGGYFLDLAVRGAFAWLPFIGTAAPWRIVLVLVGLPGLAVAALLLGVPEPPRRRGMGGTPGQALPLIDVVRGFRARAATLVPLYIAAALFSLGDYGLLAWSPAFLSRDFAFTPVEIGLALGGIAIATGIVGSVLGGYVADRRAMRSGSVGRLQVVVATALFGVLGACVGFAPTAPLVLAALTIWMLSSAISGTVAITALLELVPNEMRGVGTSLVSFCNTIVGLGLGPTLVALATDHVFADETSVGLAMTLVVLPASILAIILFYRALRIVAAGSRIPAEI